MARRTVICCVLAVVLLLTGTATGSGAAPVERQSYIVVLDPSTRDVDATAAEVARTSGGRVGFVYRSALKGFSITATPQAIAGIANNPRVSYVEADQVVTIAAQELPTGIRRIEADTNSNLRIDGHDERVDVNVAVIDTGIDHNHPDLNVAPGVNCSGGNPLRAKCAEGLPGDDNGHGTHVAGTIGAIDNAIGVVGVAPGATVHPVKVLRSDGAGYVSWIVAGIDWVAANADTIEVANMSLGGSGYSQAEYDAIQGAVDKGVAFAVAAGNSDADASGYSPAGFDNVLSVSALADFDGAPGGAAPPTCRDDQDDTLADFSNWGTAVDIAAPGVCIRSTWPGGGYHTISGTSMASPHAAGALALLASTTNPGTADDVEALYLNVTSSGNDGWEDDSGDGRREPLLDVVAFGATLVAGSGGSSNTAPTATISGPADGASFTSGTSISFSGSAGDAEDGDLTDALVWTSSVGGQIGTGGSFSAVLADGTHQITATVTDSAGATASDVITITVEATSTSPALHLSVTAWKDKGSKYADLTWGTTTAPGVDVYRDGVVVATTPNDGAHTDGPLGKGGGSATYQVCEAGTTTCSNTVTASW